MNRRAAAAASLLLLAVAGCSGSGSDKTPNAAPTAAPVTVTTAPGVGVVTETFVDTSRRTDANGKCPALPSRTLPTTIYYPTGTPSAQPQPSATPARQGPYPLIVFAHGFTANPQLYSALLTQWAEAGYVVAAPLFPLSGSASRCGPIAGDTANQPGDMRFVLTSVLQLSSSKGILAGLIDQQKIAAAGHSEGAITTLGYVANTCCRDPRVRAAVVLAGTAQKYPNGKYDFAQAPPLLLVHGVDDSLVPYISGVAVFNQAHGPKGLLSITHGDHGSAADPAKVGRATVDFFDAYLRGNSAALQRLPQDATAGTSTMRFDATVGSTATIPTPAAPKLNLRATASQTTDLVNGQKITITWSGYTAGKVINILQCNASDRDLSNSAGCDYQHAALLHPDPTGSGSVELQIIAGRVGNGVCDAAHPGCFLLVNNASSTDPASNVFIPISFRP
jgi:predicted dienelactone hydrolase